MKNENKFKPAVSHYPDADGRQVPGTEDYATKEEFDRAVAQAAAGKSGKWYDGIWGAIGDIGSNLFKIWQPADQTVYNVNGGSEKKDNTMLYVGIGGVVLVVILFAIIALKKK